MNSFDKQTKIVAASFLGFTVLFACVFFIYSGDPYLPGMSTGFRQTGADIKSVNCRINANVGTDKILRLKIAIPYQDHRQRKDLKRNISRITSEFLMATDSAKIEEWLETRRLEEMKPGLLKAVNKYAETPVEDIYYESLNW